MIKKKINLGLDIGIASVGWSLIDEDSNIIDLGVRLFDDVANSKDGKLENEKRRNARSLRRRIRRTRTRKQAFVKFLIKNNWVSDLDSAYELFNIDITKFNVENPIELKVKALKEKVSKEALIYILFHYIHHRGYFYKTELDLEEENKKQKEIDKDPSDKDLFPSEKIFKFWKENNWYKGHNIDIAACEYVEEIKKIFEVQNISDSNFINLYLEIFSSTRKFEEGPGSEHSPTPYGLYRKNEKGEVKKIGDNLWDISKGKCTYCPEEFRGGKNSPIAEVFNLCNDISQIYFYRKSDLKLSKEVKNQILKQYSKIFDIGKDKKLKAFNLLPKQLIKLLKNVEPNNEYWCNLDENDIYGYRIKGDKKNITELKSYNQIVEWLINTKQVETPIDITNMKLLEQANDIFDKLSRFQDLIKRREKLDEISNVNPEANDKLIKNLKNLMQTHSLSYKAMKEYINFSFNELDKNENQMVYFQNTKNQRKLLKSSNETRKYIDKNIFNEEVISPTTRRSFIQTINIVNKIIKKYLRQYELNSITIEMPRDRNSAEERKNIENSQKKNQKIVENILKENDSKIDISLKYQTKLRLKLWNEQNKKDIYDGESISFDDVLSGKDLDIDHIIPYSISQDDSFNNKVLTKKVNNRNKGNLTPYSWLSKSGKFEEFKNYVAQYLTNYKKAKILISEIDPNSEFHNFIARNLVDTRYASRLILDRLQDFFKDKETKIKVIRGLMTHYARYSIFVSNGKSMLPKNRDVYCHHAIDASIVCWLGMNHKVQLLLNSEIDNYEIDNETKRLIYINHKTGEKEFVNINDKYGFDNKEILKFGKKLSKYNSFTEIDNTTNEKKLIQNELANKVKYSRMYITKQNISLSDETIYSIKRFDKNNPNNLTLIRSIHLVDLQTKIDDLKKFFDSNNKSSKKENLFCYKTDKNLYTSLSNIYQRYNNAKNPFIEYMQVEHNISNPKFVLLENQKKVKKLRYVDASKDLDNVILLNKHNDNAIFQSLNWLSQRIYINDKEKPIVIAINQKTLKFNSKNNKLVVDKQKLNDLLISKNINPNSKYITLNRGSIFVHKETNNIFYVSGCVAASNIIELKCLKYDNKFLSNNSDGRLRPSLSILINNYYYAEVDELGNVYNRQDIKNMLKSNKLVKTN